MLTEEYISRARSANKDGNEPPNYSTKNELNISIVVKTINTACRFIHLFATLERKSQCRQFSTTMFPPNCHLKTFQLNRYNQPMLFHYTYRKYRVIKSVFASHAPAKTNHKRLLDDTPKTEISDAIYSRSVDLRCAPDGFLCQNSILEQILCLTCQLY